jgi:hypothetical protein
VERGEQGRDAAAIHKGNHARARRGEVIIREVAVRQILLVAMAALALGGDGRSPRAAASDYPVHAEAKNATIAAVRMTPEQLNKTFPADLGKKYAVLEVAIYPKDGATVEVAVMDFALLIGNDGETRPEAPDEVASMWRPRYKGPDLPKNTHVTTETGVIVGSGTDPATGRRVTNTGTYERVGVAVGDDPRQPPPVSTTGVDSDRMEAKLKNLELPEGKTSSPIAGYLYFPLPLKKSKGAMELDYSHDGSTAKMTLPAPAK